MQYDLVIEGKSHWPRNTLDAWNQLAKEVTQTAYQSSDRVILRNLTKRLQKSKTTGILSKLNTETTCMSDFERHNYLTRAQYILDHGHDYRSATFFLESSLTQSYLI